MEIKINGTVTINTKDSTANAAEQTAQVMPTVQDNTSKLLGNETTFNDLLAVLSKNPNVAMFAQMEKEQREAEEQEARLREIWGEDYELIAAEEAKANVAAGKQKTGRRPGAVQLRSTETCIALMQNDEKSRCEVFGNGYAVYDNGNRRVVLWVPDCCSATYYFTGLKDTEKDYLTQSSELDMEVLGDLPWYIPLMLAGENRIEYNMDHPKGKNSVSDFDPDYFTSPVSYRWAGASRFDTPEEALIKKETEMERKMALTYKQRRVYTLYYEEGMTLKEIADETGMNINTVYSHIKSIRKKLERNKELFF